MPIQDKKQLFTSEKKQLYQIYFKRYYVIDNKTGCWNWVARKKDSGYGYYGVGLKKIFNKVINLGMPAHRWSIILNTNYTLEDIKDKHIDHICRNRSCVNPDHLEVVSPKEHGKRRSLRTTHCKFGHPYDMINTKILYGRKYCRKCGIIRSSIYNAKFKLNRQKLFIRSNHRRRYLKKLFPNYKITPIYFGICKVKIL